MSESAMQAELERLRAENAQLKSKDKGGLTLKVSEKGGVSLYGMGRTGRSPTLALEPGATPIPSQFPSCATFASKSPEQLSPELRPSF